MSDPTAAPAAPAAPVVEAPAEDTKTTPPAEAPKAKAPEPEPTEIYVIDGVERQLTKTQARTLIQKAAAVDTRLQENALKEKKLNELIASFEKDPEGTLTKLGKDPAKVIAEHLARKAKLELMTPEQQKQAALEAENAELKAKTQKADDEKKAEAQAAQDAKTFDAIEKGLIAAAEKHQLDHEPETMELMLDVGIEAIDLGLQLTPDEIAQETIRREAEKATAHHRKVFSKMTPAQKVAYLGPEAIKEIMAESLKGIPAPKLAQTSSPTTPKTKQVVRVSEGDFAKKFLR